MKKGNRPFVRISLASALAGLLMLLPAGAARAEVLFDHTPSVVGFHPTVQDFEAAHDADDTVVADDFQVPAGQTWTLQRAFVDGRDPPASGPGTTNLVNVFLFASSGTLPAATQFYSMQLTADAGTTYPDFDLPLPGVAPLSAGTYWFAAQPRLDFDPDDDFWFWGTVPSQIGNPAAYRNPANGFGTGCVAFTMMTSCAPSVTNPDVSFRLEGTRTVAPTPATPKKCKKGQKLKKGKCVKKKKKKKRK